MTTTLRDRLAAELGDLDVLPDLTPGVLQRGHRTARRRRLSAGALLAAAVVAAGATVTAGGGPDPQRARDTGTAADQTSTADPTAAPATISPEYRAHYPVMTQIVDCLQGKGQAAALLRDGAVYHETPPGVVDGYNADYKACLVQVTGSARGTLPQDYTPAEWTAFYGREQDAASCLRAHGYAIPAIPPLADFKASYDGRHPWDAHSFVPVSDLAPGEWEDLVWDCPNSQQP